MLSTLLEVSGFSAITAGAAVAGGLIAALFTGGALLVLCGYAAEDERAVLVIGRVLQPMRDRRAAFSARRRAARELRQASKLAKIQLAAKD